MMEKEGVVVVLREARTVRTRLGEDASEGIL